MYVLDNWNDIYLIIYTSVIFSRMCMKAVVICLDWALIYWKHRSNSNRVFLPQQQWAGRTEAGGDGEDVEGGPAGESQTGGESSEYH